MCRNGTTDHNNFYIISSVPYCATLHSLRMHIRLAALNEFDRELLSRKKAIHNGRYSPTLFSRRVPFPRKLESLSRNPQPAAAKLSRVFTFRTQEMADLSTFAILWSLICDQRYLHTERVFQSLLHHILWKPFRWVTECFVPKFFYFRAYPLLTRAGERNRSIWFCFDPTRWRSPPTTTFPTSHFYYYWFIASFACNSHWLVPKFFYFRTYPLLTCGESFPSIDNGSCKSMEWLQPRQFFRLSIRRSCHRASCIQWCIPTTSVMARRIIGQVW